MEISCQQPLIVQQRGQCYGSVANKSLVCRNEDAEVYVFKEDMVLGIVQIKGITDRVYIVGGVAVQVTATKQKVIDSDDSQVKMRKNIVKKWMHFRGYEEKQQFNVFAHLYLESIQLDMIKQEDIELKQKIQTYQKIAEDLKKEVYRRSSPQSTHSQFQSCRTVNNYDCSQVSFHSINNDYLNELEQQYIRGQLKWAQIDMENATLNQQNKELRIQVNKLKHYQSNSQQDLLKSRQLLGDIMNMAIEKQQSCIIDVI